MKTVQETFIADTAEITRITAVEGVGIMAAMGQLESGEFIQRRDDDVFYFTEHPELSGMYDFATGQWNMRIVAEFFTDATNADEDTNEFTPIKEDDWRKHPETPEFIAAAMTFKDELTATQSPYSEHDWEDSDELPDCVSCGKPTGSRRSDGKYYCSHCWMEWNS